MAYFECGAFTISLSLRVWMFALFHSLPHLSLRSLVPSLPLLAFTLPFYSLLLPHGSGPLLQYSLKNLASSHPFAATNAMTQNGNPLSPTLPPS